MQTQRSSPMTVLCAISVLLLTAGCSTGGTTAGGATTTGPTMSTQATAAAATSPPTSQTTSAAATTASATSAPATTAPATSAPSPQAAAPTSAVRTTAAQPAAANSGSTTAASATGGSSVQAAPSGQSGPSSDTVIRVYRDWRPSAVTVISSVVQPGFRSEPQPEGTGTGFMIDGQGHILTNNHVVADADRLEVTLADGTTIPAQLVGRDSRFDLAVLRADIPANQLRPTTLGDSDQLQVGEQVIAIGNPYGLEGTVTSGIVSSRRPVVSEPEGDGVLVNAIQTDTSINPGNSGGPLLNDRGEVVGITTLGLMPQGGQTGLNFAIPINSAKKILGDLIANGSYAHPFVGIGTAEITSSVASQLSLPVQQGLLVQSVDPNSAAGQAGVRAGSQQQQQAGARAVAAGGDIVTAVDGRAVKRPEDFISYLELQKKAGDAMTLTVLRNGQQQDISLTLGQRPPPAPVQAQPPQGQPGRQPGAQPGTPPGAQPGR
jgi:S1-C subfamily serine protease